jgi:hypothetical protein
MALLWGATVVNFNQSFYTPHMPTTLLLKITRVNLHHRCRGALTLSLASSESTVVFAAPYLCVTFICCQLLRCYGSLMISRGITSSVDNFTLDMSLGLLHDGLQHFNRFSHCLSLFLQVRLFFSNHVPTKRDNCIMD